MARSFLPLDEASRPVPATTGENRADRDPVAAVLTGPVRRWSGPLAGD